MSLGPFALKGRVGRGGAGVVYEGVHTPTGVPVAVKVFHPGQSGRRDSGPFRNEVRSVASLDHPGIVWVFDVGRVSAEAAARSNGELLELAPYLAMEFASGGTLARWTPPDYDAVYEMLQALLAALAHAHARQMIHRDLKPGNVLRCTHADVRPGWKLTDFGTAASFEETLQRSLTAGLVGTIAYMAPEQIEGRWRTFGPWTDLYALGCVLYKVLAGTRPWGVAEAAALLTAHLERQPEPLRPCVSVPDGFNEWVRVLLEKRPRDRFLSAAEASRALQGLGPGLALAGSLPQALAGGASDATDAPTDSEIEPWVGSGSWPRGWRSEPAVWPAPRLVGAGLQLLGLRTPPLVGRVTERDQLWRCLLEAAYTRRTRAVILRGRAGVGKTRLARWLGRTAHARLGWPALIGQARPGEPPDAALVQPFVRWLRTYRLESEQRVALLRARWPDLDPMWAQELAAVLGASDDGAVQVEGDARHVVLGQALAQIAGSQGAVLVLDDAHASTDVLRFVRYVVRTRTETHLPLLVVAVVADEALARDPDASAWVDDLQSRVDDVIELGPLEPTDLARMLQAMLPVEGSLAAQISERTGGNPLHALHVIQDWARTGAFQRGVAGLELGRAPWQVPPMEDLWRRRIGWLLQGLPRAAESALELAAALGPQVDDTEWQWVCDDPKAVQATLGRVQVDVAGARLREELKARIVRARLGDLTDDGVALAHEMFREAVLSRARVGGRLQSHHRACARMLLHRPRSHRHAERIGRHLLEGGRASAAVDHLWKGIRGRRRRSGEASTLPLIAVLERALREAGVPDAQRAWCQVACLRADVFAALGRDQEASRWASVAQGRASRHEWLSLEAKSLWVQAQVRLRAGDPSAADALLSRAESLLCSDDDVALRGEVHAARARCARARGELGPSRGHALLAAEALTEAEGARRIAQAWQVLGEDALAAARMQEAEHALRQAWTHLKPYPMERGFLSALLGQVASSNGDLERARRLLRSACAELRQTDREQLTTALLWLAQVHLARRDWEEARRVAGELVTRLAAEPNAEGRAAAHAVLVAAAAAARDWSAFDVHLDRVRAAQRESWVWAATIEQTLVLAAHRTEAAGEGGRAAALHRLAATFTRPAAR